MLWKFFNTRARFALELLRMEENGFDDFYCVRVPRLQFIILSNYDHASFGLSEDDEM